MKTPDTKNDIKRDYYIDNVKAILILFVVFGHFAMKFPYVPIVNSIKLFIYVFHMPCFVFISGYLAKSAFSNGKLRSDKILSFLWLYLFFKVSIAVINTIMGKEFDPKLFYDVEAPWYLLSMVVWYLLIPFIASIKPTLAIIGTLLAGVLIGYLEVFGVEFSMSRNFVFFHFFVMGFYTCEETLKKIRQNRKLKIASIFILFVTIIVFLTCTNTLSPYLKIIYGANGYASISTLSNIWYGGIWRTVWYFAAYLLSAAFLMIIPNKKMRMTEYGARTLQIYILHILVRKIMVGFGIFEMCKNLSNLTNAIICFGGSILLTMLLGCPLFEKLFNILNGKQIFRKVLR